MERQTNMRGWLASRCARLWGSEPPPERGVVSALPTEARELVLRAFQSLTAPIAQESDPIRWALADCEVNGQASAAIVAVMGDIAVPVFVMPVPTMILRNWRGDALRIEPHALLGGGPSNRLPWCPCNASMGPRPPRRKPH